MRNISRINTNTMIAEIKHKTVGMAESESRVSGQVRFGKDFFKQEQLYSEIKCSQSSEIQEELASFAWLLNDLTLFPNWATINRVLRNSIVN